MTISYQLVEVVIFLLGILASVREVDSTTVSPNVDSTTEEILEADANGIGTVDISTEATVTFRTDMITTEGTEENLVTEESEQSSDEVVTVYHTTADEPVDVAKAQRMGLWDAANDQHPEAEPSPEPTSNVSTATSVIATAPLDSEAEPGQEILATETAVLGDLNGRISNGTADSLPPVAVHLVLQYGGKNASSSHQQYAASSLATGSRQSSVTTAGALSKSCDLDCINGDCVLQEYEATCQCHDGYEQNHDQTSCSDISECKSTTTNDCSQFAKCIELDGSFNCSCADGYDDLSPDRARPGRVCEVASSDICPSTYCLNGGTCHGDSIANQTCRREEHGSRTDIRTLKLF
ncbi:EGF-containing fibulin-like extracellular matrix protein 1 [Ptychodera flava]|uniref:EGF-containing fibulin-like extracellular matrix protein 1 n=1 Tax=Ptychodera flava TaxID=63121 RepID=UPI00396A62EB